MIISFADELRFKSSDAAETTFLSAGFPQEPKSARLTESGIQVLWFRRVNPIWKPQVLGKGMMLCRFRLSGVGKSGRRPWLSICPG